MKIYSSLWRDNISKEGFVKIFPLLLSAILIISGFFVFSPVLAEHMTTVMVEPIYVQGNHTDTYTFGVTNNGPDSIYKIVIAADSGFTINNDPTCPTNWESSHTNTAAQCMADAFGPDVLIPGNSFPVFLSATSPNPDIDTLYTWTVATKDSNGGYESSNTEAQTLVDVTSPVTIDDAITGWGNSDVMVTLTPTDDFVPEVPGSGVDYTYYCIYDSGESACDPNTEGTSVEVTCEEDSVCEQIISYYSVDNVGLEEAPHDSAIIQIDKEEPTTEITVGLPQYENETTYVTSATAFALTASDGEGSEVASTWYQIDDKALVEYESLFSVIEAGLHVVTYWSIDNVDNAEVLNALNIYVDDTPPTIGAISIDPSYPDGGTTYISGTSDISASVNDGDGSGVANCEYTIDGSTWHSATYSAGICTALGIDTSVASSINIRATDNVGNQATGEEAVAVTPDTTKPTISDVSIEPVDPSNNNTPTIEFNLDDIGSGVAAVEISDGTDTYTPTCNPAGSYVCSLTLPELADGDYTFTISAQDNVDNLTTSQITDYTIDTVKPNTSDNAPMGWQDDDVIITLTPSDPAPSSGLDWTKYCIDATNECNPVDGTDYTVLVTISDEGITYFRYASKDNAGNIQNTVSKEIQIDKSDPITSEITSPINGDYIKETVVIEAIAEDNGGGSGINRVEFYYDSISIGTDYDNLYSVEWNTTLVDDGVYSLTAKAYDEAGNSLTSAAVSVIVDNTPPEIDIYTLQVAGEAPTTDDNVIFSPNNDLIKDTVTIDIEFSETVDYEINIKNGGGTIVKFWTGTAQNPNPKTWDGEGNTGDGDYTIEIIGTDYANNNVTDISKTITLDNTAPTVAISYELDNPFTVGDLEITATYSETVVGTPLINIDQPGATDISDAAMTDSGDQTIWTYTYTIHSATEEGYEDGTAIISLSTVADPAGNETGAPTGNTFVIDTTDPTITDFNAPVEDTVYRADVPLQFTPNDTGTAVTCSYSIDGGESVDISCDAGVPFDEDIAIGDSRHSLTVTITDEADNSFTTDPVSFVVNLDGILDVPADFEIIQTTIDKAIADEIVRVAAGTYPEDIIIDKSLILRGAQAGIDARGRSASESEIVGVVEVTSEVTNIVFDGFKFTSPTRGFTPRGFNLRVESASSIVKNNIFVAEENAGHTYSGYLDFEGITNTTIEQNVFSGDLDAVQEPNVIRLGISGAGTVMVRNNEMHDVGGGGGIGVMSTNAGAIINIENNEIDNTGDGIWVWSPSTQFDILRIDSNDIYNCQKKGIKIVGPVDGNTIISNNDIYENCEGVNTNQGADVHVNLNRIYGNTCPGTGIQNESEQGLDAKFNWWGTTTGPYHESNPGGEGDEVSDYVSFRPWCIEETCAVLDSDAPSVVAGSQTPPNGAVGVSLLPRISLEFSEEVQCGNGNWANCFSLDSVTGAFAYSDSDNKLTFTPGSNLDYNTEYTANITGVIDLSGNFLIDGDVSWQFITLTNYSISLESGMNLISIPTIPSQGTAISDVLGAAEADIVTVWQYDAENDVWKVYHVGSPQTSNLDIMEPGYGYWVDAVNDTVIQGEGSLFGSQGTPNTSMPSVDLFNAWNLIGYYQRAGDESAPISSALSSLADKWTTLITYINGSSVPLYSDTMVNPGDAFWAFLTKNAPYGPGNKYTD